MPELVREGDADGGEGVAAVDRWKRDTVEGTKSDEPQRAGKAKYRDRCGSTGGPRQDNRLAKRMAPKNAATWKNFTMSQLKR